MYLRKAITGSLAFAFVAALALPLCALGITTDEETYVATEAEAAQALAEGTEGMPAIAETLAAQAGEVDDEGALEALDDDGALEAQAKSYKVLQVAGKDRYATAVAAAKKAYPSGVTSGCAIIVNGEDRCWPDAMSVAGLAGALDCPILYCSTSQLPSTTSKALGTLGVKDVIIVGGTPSVSASVKTDIEALGITTKRLSGANRYDTQAAVYNYGRTQKLWGTELAIMASGESFPDALSASPLAFVLKAPIFLCPKSGQLTEAQLKALFTVKAKRCILTGSSASVPDSMEGMLRAAVAKATGKDTVVVTRLGGSNRYQTSAKIAQWAVDKGHLAWSGAGFASGTKAPDALAGSVLQGKKGAVMLLIDENDSTAIAAAAGKGAKSVRVYGSTSTIPAYVRNDIAYSLGFKLNDIQGFKVYVDAGHGPNNTGNGADDPGAVSDLGQERTWNLFFARGIAKKLEAAGVDYFLNDDGGPYWLRHPEAVELGCNVIVALHMNSNGGTGTESLIHNASANKYSAKVQSILHPHLVKGTGLTDRGKKLQAVSILGGKLPAVLCEVGFIDSSHDISMVNTRKDTIVDELAKGILEF